MDQDLLRRFIEEYPSQPATAFLRSIEIAVLIKHWTPQVGLDPDPLESRVASAAGLYEVVQARNCWTTVMCGDLSQNIRSSEKQGPIAVIGD